MTSYSRRYISCQENSHTRSLPRVLIGITLRVQVYWSRDTFWDQDHRQMGSALCLSLFECPCPFVVGTFQFQCFFLPNHIAVNLRRPDNKAIRLAIPSVIGNRSSHSADATTLFLCRLAFKIAMVYSTINPQGPSFVQTVRSKFSMVGIASDTSWTIQNVTNVQGPNPSNSLSSKSMPFHSIIARLPSFLSWRLVWWTSKPRLMFRLSN